MSSTSSTRFAGIRLVDAIQRRWFRADRLGCACRASSSAPTTRSGSVNRRYVWPSMVAVPEVGWSSPRISPHRGGLARPVRPEKPGDHSGFDRAGQVVDCTRPAEHLGQARQLDHRAHDFRLPVPRLGPRPLAYRSRWGEAAPDDPAMANRTSAVQGSADHAWCSRLGSATRTSPHPVSAAASAVSRSSVSATCRPVATSAVRKGRRGRARQAAAASGSRRTAPWPAAIAVAAFGRPPSGIRRPPPARRSRADGSS